MDEIIKSISAKLSLPEATVREGIGVMLNFVKQRVAGTEFEKFLAMVPGSEGLAAAAAPAGSPGAEGILGGILGKAGGMFGGDFAAAAEAMGALQKAGIPMDKAIPLASEFFAQAKTIAGPDAVNAMLDQMPALKSLLGKAA
jgi:hypothetical protein